MHKKYASCYDEKISEGSLQQLWGKVILDADDGESGGRYLDYGNGKHLIGVGGPFFPFGKIESYGHDDEYYKNAHYTVQHFTPLSPAFSQRFTKVFL